MRTKKKKSVNATTRNPVIHTDVHRSYVVEHTKKGIIKLKNIGQKREVKELVDVTS